MELTRAQRRFLSAEAHRLDPVVMVGKEGPTDGVIEAVSEALRHHELIKVRFQAYKDVRREIAAGLAEETDSVLVGVIGHVAILYRMQEDPVRRRIRLPRA